MEFMTTEYVAEQAKDEISALECSWEHHHQGETAPYDEFVSAVIAGKYGVKDAFCACCLLFKRTHSLACADEQNNICPLFDESNDKHHCCDGAWKQLKNAFDAFKVDMSLAKFKAFQEAEGKLCDYISGVLERKRAEQEKNSDKWCSDCKYSGTTPFGKPCSDCMIQSRPKWQPKESKPALTYSIGDRFKDRSGDKYILANDGHSGQHFNKLRTGTGDGQVFKAEHNYAITEEELRKTQRFGEMTRYWDSQKEELLDLALRAEDRTEFDISDVYGGDYSIRFSTDMSEIWIKKYGQTEGIAFKTGTIIEAYKKMGQMLATQVRKWGKQKSK